MQWASRRRRGKRKYTTTEVRDPHHRQRQRPVRTGKCIRCGLCVAIAEKHGEDIGLAFIGPRLRLEIRVPFDHSFDEALQKVQADECVAARPTAAIAFRNKEDVKLRLPHDETWIEL